MLNSDLEMPEVDMVVYEYTDIPMKLSLSTYAYKFKPWNNDSRYLYSHDNMQKEIDDLNMLMKSMVPRISVLFISAISYSLMVISCYMLYFFHYIKKDLDNAFIFGCIFLGSFIHYMMCMVCRYIITKNVIISVESRIMDLNVKYKDEQIYFKLINLSALGFKYLKFHFAYSEKVHYAIRVIYKYCRIT
ncbi:hypothetical protein, conserved [Plasmodium gonderi]|uniref:Uncharacterized protein n=1 Tax=Plasmodium gonderi TaxID=77519 RepID=A0A1Y1JDW2_PLAGO|nr:hypothetical protein, conserved [Plasmodium gonderi]GAW80711.1 hypothetical protein, conserved [Plasmodium gonderi]